MNLLKSLLVTFVTSSSLFSLNQYATAFCPAPIKAIIFDCGGVIVKADKSRLIELASEVLDLNTEQTIGVVNAFKSCCEERGDQQKFWENYFTQSGKQMPQNWLKTWEGVLLESLREIKGMLDLVKFLKSENYTVGMLSNMTEFQESFIHKLGFFPLFDPLLLSYELGVEKPDLKIYEILLNSLQVAPSDCVFIDDKVENVEAANSVGIQGILFNNKEQLEDELSRRGVPTNFIPITQ